MKVTREILHALALTLLAFCLCACHHLTFADYNPVGQVEEAAGIDIPEGEGQIPVDGTAVLEAIARAVPSAREFKPATLVSISDTQGISYLLYFSRDRRYFAFNDTGWCLTRRQARAVNKLI